MLPAWQPLSKNALKKLEKAKKAAEEKAAKAAANAAKVLTPPCCVSVPACIYLPFSAMRQAVAQALCQRAVGCAVHVRRERAGAGCALISVLSPASSVLLSCCALRLLRLAQPRQRRAMRRSWTQPSILKTGADSQTQTHRNADTDRDTHTRRQTYRRAHAQYLF